MAAQQRCCCDQRQSLLFQVSWLCWQYTLTVEGSIILGHMPIPEYNSFLVSLKVPAALLHLQVNPAVSQAPEDSLCCLCCFQPCSALHCAAIAMLQIVVCAAHACCIDGLQTDCPNHHTAMSHGCISPSSSSTGMYPGTHLSATFCFLRL